MNRILANKWYIIIFLAILSFGMYLRFWNIQYVQGFGWDQARDAWKVRDLLAGNYPLEGPKTGIGQFHLGPLHYYFMAPFFIATQLDPMASNYYNIFINTLTFLVVFFVLRSIFNTKTALIGLLLYATSWYLIRQNIIPWNVSLLNITSFTIFLLIIQIVVKQKYKLIPFLAMMAGFFFHVHFTAIFIIPIIGLSLLLSKHKLTMFKYSIASLPLFFIFLIPNLLFDLNNDRGDTIRLTRFFDEYYHGFSFRFMLHKSSDAMLMFQMLIKNPLFDALKYIIPITFYLYVYFKEKSDDKRLIALLTLPWLILPWWGFTLYSGPTSDYYYLINLPIAFYIILYLQNELIKLKPKVVIPILVILWLSYIHYNTQEFLIKPKQGGLEQTKQEVQLALKESRTFSYNEGDIKPYLVTIWKDDQIRQSEYSPQISITNTVRNDTPLQQHHETTTSNGFYATWLWQFTTLQDQDKTKFATDAMRDQKHGILFEIDQNTTSQSNVEYKGTILSQYTQEEKKKIITTTFENFKLIFGYHAEVVGFPEVQASDLVNIRKIYGIKSAIIINKSLTDIPQSNASIPDRQNLSLKAQNFNTSTKVLLTTLVPYTQQTLPQLKEKYLNTPTGILLISNEMQDYDQTLRTIKQWKDEQNIQVNPIQEIGYKRLLKKRCKS
jgi:hypothetical protein